MAVEKRWLAVGPIALTAPGQTDGRVTVATSLGFKVKMVVRLSDTVLPALSLEVKRVISSTQLELGPIGTPITTRSDLSSYSATSSLFAQEQPRNSIPLQEIDRAIYEEEPTVAERVTLIDPYGDFYTNSNPLPINASISVGYVKITAEDNVPDPGDIHDSVRIGDGTDELEVNADGSINVNIVSGSPSNKVIVSTYNEITAVASGVLTTITTYTIPILKTAQLQRVSVNGDNIAEFTVLLNATLLETRRTNFGAPLNEDFTFTGTTVDGPALVAGDQIIVKVIHSRPTVGKFGARIQTLIIG